jgi:putative ABC transport system permease protein
MPRGNRVYRLLLRTFPRSFRQRFGAELEDLFERESRDILARRGRRGWIALWARTIPTVLANGWGERRTQALEAVRRAARTQRGSLPDGRRRLEIGGRVLWRAARSLTRSPRYVLATVATFGLVIGAGTLLFTVADALLLRPLPYPRSDELLAVGQAAEGEAGVTSAYALTKLAESAKSVASIAWFNTYVTTLTGAGDPVRLDLTYTSANYFDVVGVSPAVGRGFLPNEAGPGAPSVVVISNRLWQSRFQADPAIRGRTMVLDGWPYVVAGVMPAGFEGPDDLFRGRGGGATDIWMPSQRDVLADGPGYQTVWGVARLRPGARPRRLVDEAARVASALHAEAPRNFPERGFSITTLRSAVVNPTERRALLLVAVAVVLVFLVGCANVATLAVGRGLSRDEGRAVRIALGAGPRHLAAELLAEVILLGVLGGCAGLGVAAGGLQVFLAHAPPFALADHMTIDARVAGAALAITLLATLLGALLPSLRVAAQSPARILGSSRRLSARTGTGAQKLFVGFQVTVAVALLAGAFLAQDSLTALLAVDRGFHAEGVRVAQIDLPPQRYADGNARMRFIREATRTLEARPSISRVAFVTSAPQVGINNFGTRVGIQGWQPVDPADQPGARFRAITPGYLDVMGIGLVRGRPLDSRDVVHAEPAGALVNEEFVRRYLSDGDALGRSLSVFGQAGIPVVGIVHNVRYGSFADPPVPEVYLPLVGRFNTVFLVARGRGSAAAVTAALRDGVHSLDPSAPMENIPSMASLVARTVGRERFLRLLVAALAGLVVALAALGTYAVLAEAVARRTRELGIRAALGARRRRLLGSVLLQAGGMLAGGAAVGLVVAYLGARVAQDVLFGVTASAPGAYASSALLVSVAGLMAAWVPAWRATRADPLRALRED